MSFKAIFFTILILLLAAFGAVKIMVLGNPASHFNQTIRFRLGEYSWLRTAFGLHRPGDARGEYLSGQGPVMIEWFKPQAEDVDQNLLQEFADRVAAATGRRTELVYGGAVSDGTVPLANLDTFRFKAAIQTPPGGSNLLVFFTQDYSPRSAEELAAPYQEFGLVVSLSAHRSFLGALGQHQNEYLLTSLLRAFGGQLGLPAGSDDGCVMKTPPGIGGRPYELYSQTSPADFCAAEKAALQQLKTQFN
ncbi:MAG TPA: hypothetical protein VHA30_05140 [Patescibacteria group bacterium]|nr:hypothetical protein [Patescibacteria group bacterium]